MKKNLLLSGRPGVGKTTVVKAITHALDERADGFYTEEIRARGKRQGFRLIGLRGEVATLAHVQLKGLGRPHISRYGVDIAALNQVGVAALQRALTRNRVIIIDEIGKMELFSEAFKQAMLTAMDSQMPVIATVMARAHPWVDVIKVRTDVELWQVTVENRDEMPSRVLDWVRSLEETQRL